METKSGRAVKPILSKSQQSELQPPAAYTARHGGPPPRVNGRTAKRLCNAQYQRNCKDRKRAEVEAARAAAGEAVQEWEAAEAELEAAGYSDGSEADDELTDNELEEYRPATGPGHRRIISTAGWEVIRRKKATYPKGHGWVSHGWKSL